jgi:hypothetical protein
MWTLKTSLNDFVLVLVMGCWKMQKPPHPIEATLQQIEGAIQAKLYYLAVVVTLTLPDICAALEDVRAYSGRDEYKKWYRENLAGKFPSLSDSDAYSLRCGMVHKGNLGLKSKKPLYSRVVFTLPHLSGNAWHNCVSDDCLQFDAVMFCNDVIQAVRLWCEKTAGNKIVSDNLPSLIQFRSSGLPPHFVGMPVIA